MECQRAAVLTGHFTTSLWHFGSRKREAGQSELGVSLTADSGQGNILWTDEVSQVIIMFRFRVLTLSAPAMALVARAAAQAAGLKLTETGAAQRFVAQRLSYRALQGVREGQDRKRLIVAAVDSQPTLTLRATMHAVAIPSAPAAQESPQSPVAVEADVKAVNLQEPVVTVDWLHANLHSDDIKVVDGSWHMPAEKRNPRSEYEVSHIPKAVFFDLDKIVDLSSNLPHMLPSQDSFAAAVSALGIENKDLVVVYDSKGIFSAARVWWMFRVFGHDKVVILDGGLPKWQAAGYEIGSGVSPKTLENIEAASEAVRRISSGENVQTANWSFKAVLRPDLVWSIDQVKQNLEDEKFHLIDARSKGRFDGTVPEPRAGIRGGHIPGSKCVPFNEVLTGAGTLLPAEELEKKFKDAEVSIDDPVVASCGTGVTACILALSLYRLGKKHVPVYDGSWTEWGMSPDTPVAVNNVGRA